MPTHISFIKTSKGTGSRMRGRLKWLPDEYEVVTGGYGKGAIPDGLYDIEVYKAVEGDNNSIKSGFINPITGRGWFLPLSPKFSTVRHGFGIHPDGNLPGTKGCVGLQDKDIQNVLGKMDENTFKSAPIFFACNDKN